MQKVELVQKGHDNPFYGKRAMLSLYQFIGKATTSLVALLTNAWKEVSSKEDRQLFWSILFEGGEVVNRQHSELVTKKMDEGGLANNENWLVSLLWTLKNHPFQFSKFLPAYVIYVGMRELVSLEIRTTKKTKNITGSFGLLNEIMKNTEVYNALLNLLVKYITDSNPFHSYLVAKFVSLPRYTGRKYKTKKGEVRKSILQTATKQKYATYEKLLTDLSSRMNWEIETKPYGTYFKGYIQWRKPLLEKSEWSLFSQKTILLMDKMEFFTLLSATPAQGRLAIRRRLLTKEGVKKGTKWMKDGVHLGDWFLEWEKFKEQKQTEVRVLETKVKEGVATQEEKETLVQVKKEAKVTVGADNNFEKMFQQIILGSVDKLKIQPFLDKFSLHGMNFLPIIDESSSMNSLTSKGFSAADMGAFIATILLHLSEEKDLLGTFSDTTRMFSSVNSVNNRQNRLMGGQITQVSEPLYDTNKHFLDNLHRMRGFFEAIRQPRGTDISSIPQYLNQWVNGESAKLEMLMKYPVWVLVSDGEFNNMLSPESSMNDFLARCEQYFGFRPYIIIIDVSDRTVDYNRFAGVPNVMMVPPNPNQISAFLTNFKNVDVVDVYKPLLTLFQSDRKQMVRDLTI